MLPPDCLSDPDVCLKTLHSVADFWFGKLMLSTKIVAVGLIFEAPELIYDIVFVVRRIYECCKLNLTSPERHVPDWVKVVAFVGWLLIVGGVLGEWYTEGKFNEADTDIQELNDTLLSNAKKELEATFMRTRPRMIYDVKKFEDFLKTKPRAKVEILFKPEDEEAYTLGMQIRARLTDVRPGMGAGWTVSVFRPLKQSDALPDKQLNRPEVPLAIKSGAWYGFGFVVNSAPYPCFDHEDDSPVCALQAALMASGVGGGQISLNPRMPDNVIKIIIGQEESGH